MRSDTLVLVTARNEGERIGATLAALASALPDAPLFLADDGSTDATAEIALRAGARVVRPARALGKGGAATLAAREALREARAYGGDRGAESIVLLCDGDLGESAARVAPLVEAVRSGQADLAVAVFERRLGGGLGLAVAFARWAIRRRCGLRLSAPISGQRALRARVLSDVLPFAAGFGMELGMTIDAARAGHRVIEVELDVSHRATGRTPAGFAHRGRQLRDFVRAYRSRA
jgi:glycosyltransferase involved in cell wall biosynthesis